jgi:homoserine O-acetyltransferase
MGDLVDSHDRLIRDVLRIDRLHGLVGISMGAMEVFEWIVTRPESAARAVAIVGTPVTQPRDREQWAIEVARRRQTPPRLEVWRALRSLKPRTALGEWRLERADYVRQGEAIIEHDVGRRFGGSLERAAAVARSRLLTVVSAVDEAVDPAPAVAFTRLAGGDILELAGRCGHQAPACERPLVWREVSRFLASHRQRHLK